MDQAERDFLLSVFLMEAWESLAVLEEQGPELAGGADLDALHLVAHRLRGSAALHGFPRVSALAAQIEDLVEQAMVQSPAERHESALALCDLVAKLKLALEAGVGTEEPAAWPGEVTTARAGLDEGPGDAPDAARGGARPTPGADGMEALLQRFLTGNTEILEYFLPEAAEHLEATAASLQALERDGADPREIAQLFRAVHTLKGAAYTVGCQPVGDLAHRAEDLLADVRDGARALTPQLLAALGAVHDALRAMLGTAEERQGVARIVTAAGDALEGAATASTPPPAAVPEPAVSRPGPAPAAGGPPPARAAASIRVGLDRLDALVRLTGEMVSARTRLEQHLAGLEQIDELLRFTAARMAHAVGGFERKYLEPRLPAAGPPPALPGPHGEVFDELEFDRYDDFNALARSVGELSTDVGEIQARLGAALRGVRQEMAHMQRLGGELRGHVGRARMVRLARLFGRLPRQVETFARAAGCEVDLAVQGETVEIDASLVEQLTDPLSHLLRNAVVHGIEPPDERRRLGKAPRGTIALRASQVGGTLRLEVTDDGRGIDVDAVGREAVRRGLVAADVLPRLADHEVLELVFLPGLSTASRPSAAAGRGVGMDVVRTNVVRLGGTIDVETHAGRGTRFTFTLPFTIAVTEVLVVRVEREVLAIPATAVKAIALTDGAEGELVFEGRPVRLVEAGRVLGAGRPGGARRVALVLRGGYPGLAIAVDELLRKEEVVVKGLGRFLEPLDVFAGATVAPDGRVVLVLDPGRLAALAARAQIEPARGAPAGRPGAPEPGSGERRVLLVDDSVSVRRYVGQMLERAGLQVVTANDGAEALERVRQQSFDAVVTDLEMPRVDGYELIRDVRRRSGMAHVPIIVLTTRAGAKHADLARRLGVTRFVTKPVDEQSFVGLVDALTAVGGAGASGVPR